MKPILLLYAFSSLSSASLSPDFSLNLHALAPRADDILRIADHFLPKRADEEKNTAESTESTDTATASATETDTKTGTASDSTITDAPKTTDTDTDTNSDTNTDETKTGTDTGTGTETGTDTDTDTDTGKHKNKKPHKTTSISIDPAAGPGGISMLTPAATAGETFVKVGTNVTFAWNYTSLTITPSGIDVLAWNGQASRAYTITHNATVHKTQTVIWDTKDYMQTAESNPIVNGKYTLMVYDSKHGPSHIADAGHLGAYTQYTFGVYTPQSYTPWSSWKCDSCSGALSDVQRQSLKFVLAMAGLTVFSFGWFINGLGLL